MNVFTIPVPVEVSWIADAVGEDVTFNFIEAMAGQKLWIPKLRIEQSNLSKTWGSALAHCLAERYGGEQWQVPMLKSWRVRKLASLGFSNNEIIARVGVGRSYVKHTLQNIREDINRIRQT